MTMSDLFTNFIFTKFILHIFLYVCVREREREREIYIYLIKKIHFYSQGRVGKPYEYDDIIRYTFNESFSY